MKNNNLNLPIVLVDKVNCNLTILEEARKMGWRVVDRSLNEGIIPEGVNIIGAIVGKPIDQPDMEWLSDFECPVVRLGALPNPHDNQVPAVIIDYESMGIIAADHFLERNFQNIGYVGHDPWGDAVIMYNSFKKRADEKKCSCHLLRFQNFYNEDRKIRYKRHMEQLKEWLSDLPKPVGVFTHNDSWANKMATMCHVLGFSVPEDVALLGCENRETICETALVPLSSIDMGRNSRAREGFRVLKDIINGSVPPKKPIVVPPAGVICRQSSDVLAVPDPIVAKALRFIWNNLEQQISVEEIALQIGVSRSVLDHAFKRSLGRTPNAERQRKRIETCAELLRGTDLTISEIAEQIGLPSISYLHSSFKAEFGMTPREFRLKHIS